MSTYNQSIGRGHRFFNKGVIYTVLYQGPATLHRMVQGVQPSAGAGPAKVLIFESKPAQLSNIKTFAGPAPAEGWKPLHLARRKCVSPTGNREFDRRGQKNTLSPWKFYQSDNF